MGTPFLSEIKIVSFGFAPKGWALCNGQFLPINQNQALFSLLGTTYGGNGQTTFALPDLRGRASMHVGGGHDLGRDGRHGVRDADPVAQMPAHVHFLHGQAAPGDRRRRHPGGDQRRWRRRSRCRRISSTVPRQHVQHQRAQRPR